MRSLANKILVLASLLLASGFIALVVAALPALSDWDIVDALAFTFSCGVVLRVLGLGLELVLGEVEDTETGERAPRIDSGRWSDYGMLIAAVLGLAVLLFGAPDGNPRIAMGIAFVAVALLAGAAARNRGRSVPRGTARRAPPRGRERPHIGC